MGGLTGGGGRLLLFGRVLQVLVLLLHLCSLGLGVVVLIQVYSCGAHGRMRSATHAQRILEVEKHWEEMAGVTPRRLFLVKSLKGLKLGEPICCGTQALVPRIVGWERLVLVELQPFAKFGFIRLHEIFICSNWTNCAPHLYQILFIQCTDIIHFMLYSGEECVANTTPRLWTSQLIPSLFITHYVTFISFTFVSWIDSFIVCMYMPMSSSMEDGNFK